MFKEIYCTKQYTQIYMNRKYWSIVAKLHIGILPLEIEVGRRKETALENTTCIFCKKGEIEDEYHFVFVCESYQDERHFCK